MTKQRRRWDELSRTQRALISLAAAVQLGLLVGAEVDLVRRPGTRVRGRKRVWAVVNLVNYAGPLAYFAFGRRR